MLEELPLFAKKMKVLPSMVRYHGPIVELRNPL